MGWEDDNDGLVLESKENLFYMKLFTARNQFTGSKHWLDFTQ